jgi:hypothetical protein
MSEKPRSTTPVAIVDTGRQVQPSSRTTAPAGRTTPVNISSLGPEGTPRSKAADFARGGITTRQEAATAQDAIRDPKIGTWHANPEKK